MANNGHKEKLRSDFVACWALKRSGMSSQEIAKECGIKQRMVNKRIEKVQEAIDNVITPGEIRASLAMLFPVAYKGLESLLKENDSQTVNNYFNKLGFQETEGDGRVGVNLLLAVLSDKLSGMSLQDLQALAKSAEIKQLPTVKNDENEPQPVVVSGEASENES